MQALRQHLALAHRVSFTSHHLESVMKVTLNTLAQPVSATEEVEEVGDGMDSLPPLDPPLRRSSGQPLTEAAAGSAGAGPAVASTDRQTSVNGLAAHMNHINSRPSALHRVSSTSTDAKLQHKHLPEDRHVQIVEASSRNGAVEPVMNQGHNSSMEQHLNDHSGVDLRSSLATWVESARSKLGMHAEDGNERPLDKTTDNRGGSESTSEAVNMPRDSISSSPALHQNSLTFSQGSMPNLASTQGRAGEVHRTSLERRDSLTSSVYITIESPNNVARHLLEDLARMTKAGTLTASDLAFDCASESLLMSSHSLNMMLVQLNCGALLSVRGPWTPSDYSPGTSSCMSISHCHSLTLHLACCLPAAQLETYAFGSQQLPLTYHCAAAYLADYNHVS